MIVRFRLAPTPSGFLHAGNLFNFLLTERRCREQSGSLRLRIDDLDAPRARPEYLTWIFRMLEAAGIHWQHGPHSPEEHQAQYRQALRMEAYKDMLQKLVQSGKVFACRCSRAQVLATHSDGKYPGTCRFEKLPLDAPDVAWRIDTQDTPPIAFEERFSGTVRTILHELNPHFIIRRRDGLPAYQVASLSDDLAYGITHIVRGRDLLGSTFSQAYLSQLLGGTAFEQIVFEHHALLRTPEGAKLSKSAGDRLLATTPEDLSGQLNLLRQQVAAYEGKENLSG